MVLEDQLCRNLASRAQRSLLQLPTITPPASHDFSSNDFLGLARSPLLRDLFLKELVTFKHPPLGSTGSRLLSGNSVYFEDLERRIARFHNAETALIFNSGFEANSSFFTCVPQPGDVVLYDELIHASVLEGLKLTRAAHKHAFAHNNMVALEALLARFYGEDANVSSGERRNIFISVETIYSMDGDAAPLREIVNLLRRYWPDRSNGYLVVDEAHSTGVFGPCGRGMVAELGLEDEVFARLHTFTKALASGGAALLCTSTTRSYLFNNARVLRFSTSLPFCTLASISCAYALLSAGHTTPIQSHLYSLIAYFRTLAKSIPLLPAHPASPIQGILLADSSRVLGLTKYLHDRGFIVGPVGFPAVAKGSERVRVCLHASNTAEEISSLVGAVEEWLAEERGMAKL